MTVGALHAFEALVADDDDGVRELLVDFLTERGVRVASAVDGRAAVTALERSDGGCRLVFADISMPGADGFEVLSTVRRTSPHAHVVMITGYGSLDTAVKAVKLGAQDYLTKPFSLGQVDVILQQADARWAAVRQQSDSTAISTAIDAVHGRLTAIEQVLRELHRRVASLEPGHRGRIDG